MSDDEDNASDNKSEGAPVVAKPTVRLSPELVEGLNKVFRSPTVVGFTKTAESIHLQFSPEARREGEQLAASVPGVATVLTRAIAASVQHFQSLFPPEVLKGWQRWIGTFAEGVKRAQELIARAEEMGKAGWTLPMNASWSEYLNLLSECQDPASADRAFKDYYAANERANEKELFDVLLASPPLARFRPLLEEVRFCLMHGRCRVAVPALFTLLEGALRTAWRDDAWSSNGRNAFIEAQIERFAPDNLERVYWTATQAFLSKLYAPAGATKPPALNRHWIMHGREPADADRVDCLRLLQAVDTVLRLADAEDVPHTLALESETVTSTSITGTSHEEDVYSDVRLMVTRLAGLRLLRRDSADDAELKNALMIAEAALLPFLLERLLRTHVPNTPENASIQKLLEQVAGSKGLLPVPYPLRKRGADACLAIRAFLGSGTAPGTAGTLDVGARLAVEVDAVCRLVAGLLAKQEPELAAAVLPARR